MNSQDQTRWLQTADTLRNTNDLISTQSFTAAVMRLAAATAWAMEISDADMRDRAMDCIQDCANYLADEMRIWGVDPQ